MFPIPMGLFAPKIGEMIGKPQMGPPAPPPPNFMGRLGQFADNIDHTFQSPSKQLGLGLLGQIHPGLALGGLLGAGIFGGRRGN